MVKFARLSDEQKRVVRTLLALTVTPEEKKAGKGVVNG